MMETKFWFALCALLLINSGLAEHDNAAAASKSALNTAAAPETQAADPVPSSSLDLTSPPAPAINGSDTNPSSNVTSNLSSNTTTVGETTSLKPEPKNDNDTNIVSPSVAENNRNLTDKFTTQPVLPLESHTTTSHILLTSTPTSLTHTANTAPVGPAKTTLSSHTSTSISKQPTHPKTQSAALAPTPEPPKSKSNVTATTSTQSSLTSSTSSSQEPPSSETQTLTSPHTSQPDRNQAQTTSTISLLSSSTAQAKAHVNNLSQLNVGGDTTMVHQSPTLDPLLAGLVSAFIITAVIITLLIFLKLRRRDNRPEFRRLQDLPMDDMMEDTPLSMYTY